MGEPITTELGRDLYTYDALPFSIAAKYSSDVWRKPRSQFHKSTLTGPSQLSFHL